MGWGIWNNERWGDASSEENGMKSEARSGFDSEFVCHTFDDNFLAARATRLCAPTASARFRCGSTGMWPSEPTPHRERPLPAQGLISKTFVEIEAGNRAKAPGWDEHHVVGVDWAREHDLHFKPMPLPSILPACRQPSPGKGEAQPRCVELHDA